MQEDHPNKFYVMRALLGTLGSLVQLPDFLENLRIEKLDDWNTTFFLEGKEIEHFYVYFLQCVLDGVIKNKNSF